MLSKFVSEIIYGGVDGLITTHAIIAGSIGAYFSTKIILTLGFASLLADGFSMGISSYLAEKARNVRKNPFYVGIVTFVSFILIGALPLLPFLVDMPYNHEFSVVILLGVLFLLGFLKGKWKNGLETMMVGGAAAMIAFYTARNMHKIIN
jgi:vacuolar iron transporter family protein